MWRNWFQEKSTLVDIICGFRYPNSGSIGFDENNVNIAGNHLLNTSYVHKIYL